jgi:hypothetical protein
MVVRPPDAGQAGGRAAEPAAAFDGEASVPTSMTSVIRRPETDETTYEILEHS